MLLINPTSNFQQDEEIEVDNKSVIYILIKCVQEKFELFINSNHVLLCTSSNVQYEQGVYDFIDIKSTSNIKNIVLSCKKNCQIKNTSILMGESEWCFTK